MLRYFINPILQVTSAGEVPMFFCRIVNEQYKEIYKVTLTEEEKDAFEEIMASDKGAVLNFKHKVLSDLAQFKIDHLQNQTVYNGSIWP